MYEALFELLVLAFAMSIDALTVSFSYGLILKGNKYLNALKFGIAFGFFQFIMPVLGWNLAHFAYSSLEKISKILVFAVFFILAIKFLKEAFEKKEKLDITEISLFCLLTLAVATSIDAFFAGISLRLINWGIVLPATVIGLVTFIFSCCGFLIANTIKSLSSKMLNIIGALLLMYLAIKALF